MCCDYRDKVFFRWYIFLRISPQFHQKSFLMKTSHSMAPSVGLFKIQKPQMTGVLQKWLFYKTVLQYIDSLPSHCNFAKRWNCLFQLYNTSQWTLFNLTLFNPIPYSLYWSLQLWEREGWLSMTILPRSYLQSYILMNWNFAGA